MAENDGVSSKPQPQVVDRTNVSSHWPGGSQRLASSGQDQCVVTLGQTLKRLREVTRLRRNKRQAKLRSPAIPLLPDVAWVYM